MEKLIEAYKHSFKLSEETDTEFFDYFSDLYKTDEIQGMKIYPQHGKIDRLQHILSVTYLSYIIARKRHADIRKTLRGAILHDLFYYDWHKADDGSHRLHGYRHPGFAEKNARLLNPEISEIEANIIRRHMWPLTVIPPKYKEGFIVSIADKYCATQEILISRIKSYNKKLFGE